MARVISLAPLSRPVPPGTGGTLCPDEEEGMKEFDADVERYLATLEVAGHRFERALVPPGEYVAGWERGARVRLPDDRWIVLCRFCLIDYDVTCVRIDVGAERDSRKWHRIAWALGISPRWDELPVSSEDVRLIQAVKLEPMPEPLGSVVRDIRPATPEDVGRVGDEILFELERQEWG